MRCIETDAISDYFALSVDKLQHEMYWNIRNSNPSVIPDTINYNMRCIETGFLFSTIFTKSDKLQHEMYWNTDWEVLNFGQHYR